MKVLIKGGVWKNTEDEILKAAVMKYGKNQWSRISSLLVRKTAKQCKARWYEWLDPSIKKTEWSKEEDEKLLHLAKLMPCQWRTIAPIIGRTAAQCLERYEKLLDEAQGKEIEPSEDPRKLRPGEIDPAPEAKPARPDPVDMDEDEKEMLSEARARLANTMGKKAKRKAREKQLEEARRLATLQKRRELKAAGIQVHDKKKKRKHVDYNIEIPFYHRAPLGFYDTTDEKTKVPVKKLTDVRLDQMDGKSRLDIEEQEKKKDAKRSKQMENEKPLALAELEKLNGQTTKRPKLNLPSPQVGEQELEEIVKLGYAAEGLKATVMGEQSIASSFLLSNYASISATPLRTPRTPAMINMVRLEAQNLLALQTTETPLKGGENTPLNPSNFDGITPRRTVAYTPNHLIAALTPGRISNIENRLTFLEPKGARSERSISATPARSDQLNINEDVQILEDQRLHQDLVRKQIIDSLKRLPKPKNDFEIEIDDVIQQQRADDDEHYLRDKMECENDPFEKQQREEAERLKEVERQLKACSRAIVMDLPRPLFLNEKMAEPMKTAKNDSFRIADELVKIELVSLLKYEMAYYPYRSDGVLNGHVLPSVHSSKLLLIPREEIEFARNLVQLELDSMESPIPSAEEFVKLWQLCDDDMIYYTNSENYGRWKTHKDRIFFLRSIYLQNKNTMARQAKKANKLENNLSVLLGGYQNRAQALHRQIESIFNQIIQANIELDRTHSIISVSKETMPLRIERLEEEIDQLRRKETELEEICVKMVKMKEQKIEQA